MRRALSYGSLIVVVLAGCGQPTPTVTCLTLPKPETPHTPKKPVKGKRSHKPKKPAKRAHTGSGTVTVTVPQGAVFVPTPNREIGPQKRSTGKPKPTPRRPPSRLPSTPRPTPPAKPTPGSMLDQILGCVPSLKCLPLPQLP